MKKMTGVFVFFLVTAVFLAESGLCLEDCFNYQFTRQDLENGYGWDVIKGFEEKGKDDFLLEKRWPTVYLKRTAGEENFRFSTTGLEEAKRAYRLFHYDGTTMRMFAYVRIVHAAGERKVLSWRAEANPLMPKEYLDPKYPEGKKEGKDWRAIFHHVCPADIRGTGALIFSYNNKAKDNDTWVWFPSLRKTRRLTPANGGDSVAGADLTYSEAFLLRITDEQFQIIGETRFTSFVPVDYYEGLQILDKYGPSTREYVEFYKRRIAQPRDCWVVRAKSVKGGYGDWYDTRIIVIDKEWGCDYGWETYDSKGRLMKCHIWYYKWASDYDGRPRMAWVNLLEILNFEDRGFTYYCAPQTNFGCPVPEPWFTLRELQRSIPTISIPYMAVLPPKRLAPLEELYSPEMIEVRKKFLPERVTTFPDPTGPIGIDKF